MNTITARPYGYHVDLRTPTVNEIPEATRQIIDRLRAGAVMVTEHINRHKTVYRIGALTLVVLLGSLDTAFAADSSIDIGARKIYTKLVNIGKWVIIVKGAFDTISATVQGDFIQARKSALAYIMVFVILLGLPWAFEQVEVLFQDVT